jgi:hypothetical protein
MPLAKMLFGNEYESALVTAGGDMDFAIRMCTTALN